MCCARFGKIFLVSCCVPVCEVLLSCKNTLCLRLCARTQKNHAESLCGGIRVAYEEAKEKEKKEEIIIAEKCVEFSIDWHSCRKKSWRLKVENRIKSEESFYRNEKKKKIRRKFVEIAKKRAWSEVYCIWFTSIWTVECGVWVHNVGLGQHRTRLLRCTPAYFNINDNIFAQFHLILSALAMSLPFAFNTILMIFMFGSRWMRGVINLFFCRLFACVSNLFSLFPFFSLANGSRGWRRGKMMLAFFCDYDDEESLIIVTVVNLNSRQHLTCFMAQQFTRTLHIMRVRSFVIDLCSKRCSSIPMWREDLYIYWRAIYLLSDTMDRMVNDDDYWNAGLFFWAFDWLVRLCMWFHKKNLINLHILLPEIFWKQ